MRFALILLVSVAGCGRMGFEDAANMDPLDPMDTVPKQTPPTDNLIAYWDFENMTPTGVMSQVGSEEAQCTGAECPSSVSGIAIGGVAARFDGTQTCLHIPSLVDFDSSNYTISVWAKLDDIAQAQPMLMRYNGGCSSPSIRTYSNTAAHAAYDTADVHQYAWTDSGVKSSSWQQIAIRWDGTNQSIFIDGVCSCNNIPPLRLIMAVSQEFTIGCDWNDGKHLAGNLDALRIYDRALTNDEMASLAVEDGRLAPMPVACPMQCAVTTDYPP